MVDQVVKTCTYTFHKTRRFSKQGTVTRVRVVKTCRWDTHLQKLLTSELDGVNGPLHAPTALATEKWPPVFNE